MKSHSRRSVDGWRPVRRTAVTTVVASLLLLPVTAVAQPDSYESMRLDMVEFQLRGRGISQSSLLNAMETVPRHLFVPQSVRDDAYRDSPIPNGEEDGGVMQPYLTALMIQLLQVRKTDRVLEVGTGTGYDAAVLSGLAKEVYTIEIDEQRGNAARKRLARLGYENVRVKVGDGHEGWPDEAPFDAILLTAAPEIVPEKLLAQLKENGRMVVAVGRRVQNLTVITRTPDGDLKERIEPVRISPMSVRR